MGGGQAAQGAAVRKHDDVVRWALLNGDGFTLVQRVHLAGRNHGIVRKGVVQLQPFEAVIESRKSLEELGHCWTELAGLQKTGEGRRG